jgi:dihydrofolate reductase
MRKVILFMHVSLDGFVCGPNGEQDWMTMDDSEMDTFLITDLLVTVDTLLVGRVLYEGFANFWPSVAKDPSSPKELIEFANWMESTPKVVFSKTLSSVDWMNSRLVNGDIKEEIARLKQQPGGDMVIFGGAGIVSAFTKLNLIDEYRIKLEPVVLGNGRPLFAIINNRINLKLLKSRTFNSGVVGLYYQTQRD